MRIILLISSEGRYDNNDNENDADKYDNGVERKKCWKDSYFNEKC